MKNHNAKHLNPHRYRIAFTVFFFLIMIFTARLFISASTDSRAYEIAALSDALKEQEQDYQTLSEELKILDSPQHLSRASLKLGMVSDSASFFLRLSDGKIFGSSVGYQLTFSEGTEIPNRALELLKR
jgi:hypothetical protein